MHHHKTGNKRLAGGIDNFGAGRHGNSAGFSQLRDTAIDNN